MLKQLVVNLFNEQIYRKLGLKVKDCLEFSQPQRLKPYIEFNTHTKQKHKKFMNNVVFVKKDKNLRNEIGVRLASNESDYLKWISKPRYIL